MWGRDARAQDARIEGWSMGWGVGVRGRRMWPADRAWDEDGQDWVDRILRISFAKLMAPKTATSLWML